MGSKPHNLQAVELLQWLQLRCKLCRNIPPPAMGARVTVWGGGGERWACGPAGWIKSRQNNLHSIHTRPCRIYEQSGPNNKQQSTTHGNAPKGSGSYLRPKTHIQHTHPQHLSTSTQTSTNHKSTHRNRMG